MCSDNNSFLYHSNTSFSKLQFSTKLRIGNIKLKMLLILQILEFSARESIRRGYLRHKGNISHTRSLLRASSYGRYNGHMIVKCNMRIISGL